MTSTVVGVFDNINHVESAIKQLHHAGIEKDVISMVTTAITGNQTVHGITQGAGQAGPAATTAGLFELLMGSALIWIPRDGPVISLGPIAADMRGALAGGGAHAVLDAVVGCGIPKEDAAPYNEKIRQGKYLVVVAVDADTSVIARHVLDDHGATPVDSH